MGVAFSFTQDLEFADGGAVKVIPVRLEKHLAD
jgi:hypothetical protein